MLKEIAEQPAAVADTLLGHFVDGRIVLDEQRLSDQELREWTRCSWWRGTAYHSGLLAKYAIEHWTLPGGGGAGQRVPLPRPGAGPQHPGGDQQSGETADTLEAVRHAKQQKAKVLAICNTNGSQIPRECDAVLYTRAGPEIGVAPTKTFLAQIAANYLVGLALAQARGTIRRQVARDYGSWKPCPSWWRGCWPPWNRSRSWPAASRRPRRCCFWAATSATRWRWRALWFKELAYMHAEGFAAVSSSTARSR